MTGAVRDVHEVPPHARPGIVPRGSRGSTTAACLAFAALTIVMTWPVARGLARDVPTDLGDPLLNAWILARDAAHILRALGGHLGALSTYWHAGIFYPQPYALAYSEHLTPQALEILPVYALTANPILCYNLVFLSTFFISALGTFLFVRELTGDTAAAFVAGLAFGFAPYRFGSLSHVQVLSSCWVPFVLYGLRRFFVTRRTRPLAWASVAWFLQNLSCGYYLLFFSPVVVAYAAWEVATRRLWRDRRTVGALLVAAVAVAAATAPFMLPYFELRRLGFGPRPLAAADQYSAEVWSYLTADVTLRIWGRVARAWPHPEAQLFPGLTIVVLAFLAAVRAWPDKTGQAPAIGERPLAAAFLAATAAVVALAAGWTLRTSWLRVTDLDRAVIVAAVLGLALVARSARVRRGLATWLKEPAGFFTLVVVVAAILTLGPHVRAHGRLVDDHNLYVLLYRYVPGFDGLRVPARFAMVVALGLAVLAGCGASAVKRRRGGSMVVAAAGALILIESLVVPVPVNLRTIGFKQSGLVAQLGPVRLGAEMPDAYRFVASLPADTAILELPFGEPAFEVRYMLHTLDHHHPIVNGYSGGSPRFYDRLSDVLAQAFVEPDRAWAALAASKATVVIVHEEDYQPGRGERVSRWLAANGAREVYHSGPDRVFDIRHRS